MLAALLFRRVYRWTEKRDAGLRREVKKIAELLSNGSIIN